MADGHPFFTVGIGGQARAGKDTLGGYLLEHLNAETGLGQWQRRGFADAVKQIFMDIFGVDRDFVEDWKTRPDAPEGFRLPIRACLTEIGDGFRRMKSTVWIDKLFATVRCHQMVTDVRYLNEVASIRQRGGAVILLYRPGHENDIPSASEQQLVPVVRSLLALGVEGEIRAPEIPCDYFLVNGGTIPDLHRKADELVLPTLSGRARAFLA